MFHNSSSKLLLKDTHHHQSKSNSLLTNVKFNDSTGISELKRNSSYTSSDLGSYPSSEIKTLPNQSDIRKQRVSKLLFTREKQNQMGHMRKCTSSDNLDYLFSASPTKDKQNQIQTLRAQNKKLKLQMADMVLKQSKSQQLQRDYERLGSQFQKLLTGKKSFQQMLIKQIDFSKQLQKRIDIQSSQNQTLKQQIKLLQNVVSDMRKQNSSLGARIQQLSKRTDSQSIQQRVGLLQGYCLQLQTKIKQDILQWDVQKQIWRREVQMYEDVIKNLEIKLCQR